MDKINKNCLNSRGISQNFTHKYQYLKKKVTDEGLTYRNVNKECKATDDEFCATSKAAPEKDIYLTLY